MCRPDHARKPFRNDLAYSRYYDFLISSRIWNGIPAWKNCIPLRGEKIELSLLMIFFACFPEYLSTQDQFLKFLLDFWAWSIDWTLLLIAYLLNFLISVAVISILRYIRRGFIIMMEIPVHYSPMDKNLYHIKIQENWHAYRKLIKTQMHTCN